MVENGYLWLMGKEIMLMAKRNELLFTAGQWHNHENSSAAPVGPQRTWMELTISSMFTQNATEIQEAHWSWNQKYDKRLQDIATFMYKAKHIMLPPPVQELFTTGHTRYNLRNSDLFRTEHFNTKKYGKHALCYYGPSLWSKLDRKLRASTSLGSFKNAIKKMDLEALMSDCSTCSLCNS